MKNKHIPRPVATQNATSRLLFQQLLQLICFPSPIVSKQQEAYLDYAALIGHASSIIGQI